MPLTTQVHLGVFRFCIFGLSLSLVSACSYTEEELRAIAVDRFEVSAPSLEDVDELQQIVPSREKVTRIEIVAPRNGDLLHHVMANISRGYGDRGYDVGGDYFADEDMGSAVREASAYLYELDPNAEKQVKILLEIDVSSYLAKTRTCTPWITKVTTRFTTTEISTDGSQFTSSYEEAAEDSSCTYIFKVPLSGAVEDPLQEAFARTLLTTIKAQSAARDVTTSATQ